MTKKGKKQCSEKGCRKLRADGYEHCESHREFDPVEDAVKLTVEEAEKWGRLDAEIRCSLSDQKCEIFGGKLDEYNNRDRLQNLTKKYQEDMKGLATAYQERKSALEQEALNGRAQRSADVNLMKEEMERKKREYQALTLEIADKYKVDVTAMLIDPDTRIIREI